MTYILQKAQKETNYNLWIGLAIVVVILMLLSSMGSSKSKKQRRNRHKSKSRSCTNSGSRSYNSRLSSWFSNRSKSQTNSSAESESVSVLGSGLRKLRKRNLKRNFNQRRNSNPHIVSSVYSPNVKAHSPNNIRVNSPNTIYLHLHNSGLCECKSCRKNKQNNVPIDDLVDKLTKSYISHRANKKIPKVKSINLDNKHSSVSSSPAPAPSVSIPQNQTPRKIEPYSEYDTERSNEHYQEIDGMGDSKWDSSNLNDFYKTLS